MVIQVRLARSRQWMERGYHALKVPIGVFIAAAAAGKILCLDPEQMTHALAGSHAGGTMEYYKAAARCKRLHNGYGTAVRRAPFSAVGAYLATGPPTIFEGERGIRSHVRWLQYRSDHQQSAR